MRPRLYPFPTMKVGDVFEFPRDLGRRTDGGDARQQAIRTAANRYIQRHAPTVKFDVFCLNAETVRCRRTA